MILPFTLENTQVKRNTINLRKFFAWCLFQLLLVWWNTSHLLLESGLICNLFRIRGLEG